jgi:hypothetical protein
MNYSIEMSSDDMIYLPGFMKTCTGVQEILRFCLSNLRGCNVCITDVGDLRSMPLRWAPVSRYTHQVP